MQTEFELLARGSAFFVRGPSTGRPIAVVSAHVAAPHRFRHYFPQAWLQHVRDADCRSILQLELDASTSDDTERKSHHISTHSLVHGFRHATLDVGAFVVAEDRVRDLGLQVLTLPDIDQGDAAHGNVVIAGFRLVGDSGSGTERVVLAHVQGKVAEVWNSRVFVDTGSVLTEMGMCGGPAVSATDRNVCVGILEGLVPPLDDESTGDISSGGGEVGTSKHDKTHKRLQNKSVLVGAQELRSFLHDVEAEIGKDKS